MIELFKDELSTNSLNKLNSLRNDEIHFAIKQEDFLSDSEFLNLYNFMVDFSEFIENKGLMPWAFNAAGHNWSDIDLVFRETKMTTFCYSSALK